MRKHPVYPSVSSIRLLNTATRGPDTAYKKKKKKKSNEEKCNPHGYDILKSTIIGLMKCCQKYLLHKCSYFFQ